MPRLVSKVTGAAEWETNGPQTRVQKFFKQYMAAVDSRIYSGLNFFSKDVVFHNQNNAEYHGADQMSAWMTKLFSVFGRIHHDFLDLLEIELDDGTSQIYSQMVRKLWVSGKTGEEPSVSIPITMVAKIGKSNLESTPEGVDFKEVWLYWDTALLLPFLPKDAVVFKTKNVLLETEG